MTIVEAIISAAILLIGLLAGFLAMESANNSAKASERQAAAAAHGQLQMERMLAMPYDDLWQCGPPVHSSAANDPRNFVSQAGDRLYIRQDYRNGTSTNVAGAPAGELFVTSGTPNTCISAGGTPFTSGSVSGVYYRFVTWRDDQCVAGLPTVLRNLLSNTGIASWLLNVLQGDVYNGVTNRLCGVVGQDSKRLTVAVVSDPGGDAGKRRVTWFSTIQTNPIAGVVINNPAYFDF